MGWLGGLFGKKSAADDPVADFDSRPSAAGGQSDALAVVGSSVNEARDLINRCAYETLNLHGVPKDWVKLEILTLADAAKAYFQLQVTLKHWDAYLLLHSYAFEKAVVGRIRERNRMIGQALRSVLWRVDPEAGCPYEQMPPSVAWTPDAIAQRTSNPQMFKTNKPREGAVGMNTPAHDPTQFQETLQVNHGDHDADEALQRILEARQQTRPQ